MDSIKNLKQETDNNESLITILIYDKIASSVIKYLESQLEKAKNISNPIKKHKMNNRLFSIIRYLNDNFEESDIINNIFLINDTIFRYNLTESEIKIAKEYNFEKLMIRNENIFLIDYLLDLFNNFEFIYNIKINKNEYSVSKFNKNKSKIIGADGCKLSNESVILNEIENIRKNENYKDLIIIFGVSPYINKLGVIKNVLINNEFMNNNDLYNLYLNEIMKKNMIELEKRLNDLKNEKTNLDLYLFGKLKIEIKEAIESYSVKELYIEERKLEKLKEFVDESFFNFKIIVIKSLESGDSADNFIKNYNGIMGIKYF
jgi:hypothetical protein